MKKLSTLFLLVILYATASAQLSKGNLLLGGGFGLGGSSNKLQSSNNSFNSSNKNSVWSLNIGPSIGLFVTDRLVLGVGTEVRMDKTTGNTAYSNQNYQSKSFNINYYISPFARYYKPLNEKFALFGDLSIFSYALGKNSTELVDYQNPRADPLNNVTRNNYYSIGPNLVPGISFFINNKWGIEATIGNIGYRFTRTKYKLDFESTPGNDGENVQKSNVFGLNFNPSSFTIGFRYYLGR